MVSLAEVCEVDGVGGANIIGGSEGPGDSEGVSRVQNSAEGGRAAASAVVSAPVRAMRDAGGASMASGPWVAEGASFHQGGHSNGYLDENCWGAWQGADQNYYWQGAEGAGWFSTGDGMQAGWHGGCDGSWAPNDWWSCDTAATGQAGPYKSLSRQSWGSAQDQSWGPAAPSFSPSEEHTARVHYGKTYQVLSEALEAHPGAFRSAGAFLDLGCAPGGFSCRLLEERPAARGFGVTLPVDLGGFPVLLAHERLRVQSCDLMGLRSAEELDCPRTVEVCIADAQDLGRRTNPKPGRGRGRGTADRGRGAKGGAVAAGVQAVCTALGIWALTLQQLLLGFGRLNAGGTFFFRFGWRGRGASEEPWYREATVRLFALVLAHFAEVAPFKSEISHQADASFYVVATGFQRESYLCSGLDEKLREAVTSIVGCDRVGDLPWCIEALAPLATEELLPRIHALLDSVGRQRAIGLATRHHLEQGGRPSPEAALWISPVPFNLTVQRVRERLERFGKIAHIRRRAHPVGVGADALVQFTQPAHATAALEAITVMRVLGDNIGVQRLSDVPNS